MRLRLLLYVLFAIAITLFYVGCSDQDDGSGYSLTEKLFVDILPIEVGYGQEDGDSISDELTRSQTTGSGTNISTLYEYGDTIGIFPDKGFQIPFVLPLEEGETASSVEIYAQGWMTKDEVYYAVYYPFNFYNRHYNKIPWDYRKVLCQKINNNAAHLAENIFLASDTSLADQGKFHATLRMMGCIVRARIRTADAATFSKVVIVTEQNSVPTHGYYDLFDTHEPDGNAPTIDQPFHAEGWTNFFPIYLGEIDGNGKPTGVAMNANALLTVYYALPEMNVGGQTLTCYLWTNTGVCYTGTVTIATGTAGLFKRNTVNTIQFTSTSLTTTPDVYMYPYTDHQDLSGVALE